MITLFTQVILTEGKLDESFHDYPDGTYSGLLLSTKGIEMSFILAVRDEINNQISMIDKL